MLLLDHHVYVVRLGAGPFRTAVVASMQWAAGARCADLVTLQDGQKHDARLGCKRSLRELAMYAVGMSNPIFLDRHGLWSDIQKYRFEQFGQLSERAGQGSARKRQGPCFYLAHDPVPLSFCRVPDPLPYGVDAGLAPLVGETGGFIDGAGVPDHLHRDTERLLQEIPVATRADADGRWKDVLDVYFQHCVSLLWPALHALIDWTQAPVFLDKELKGLMPGRRRNRRYVDKLLAVRLRSVCITSMPRLEEFSEPELFVANATFAKLARARRRVGSTGTAEPICFVHAGRTGSCPASCTSGSPAT